MSSDFSTLQRSFDSVVDENMEVFSMSRQEAVASAIDEFKSRGVNVQMLVEDGSFSELTDRISALAPLLSATELASVTDSPSTATDTAPAQLAWLKQYCERSLAHRCAAGRLNLYSILVKWLSEQTSDNVPTAETNKVSTITVLETLSSLQNGQPDLFDDSGTCMSLSLLQRAADAPTLSSSALSIATLSWLCVVTSKHEQNRRRLTAAGLLKLLTNQLTQLLAAAPCSPEQLKLVKLVCALAANFTVDDDVRVEFGDAHNNAKRLVEAGALDALKTALVSGVNAGLYADVLESILHLATKLCVCKDNCDVVAADGGLSSLLQLLEQHSSHLGVCRRGLSLLAALTGSDAVKEDIIGAGGASLIVSALNTRKCNVIISSTGARLISCLTLRSSVGSTALCEAGVVSLLADLMDTHSNNASIQKLVCMSVRNILSRCDHLQPLFTEAEMEKRIRLAMASSKELEFEAKQALRCLGCEVQLNELWTGRGGALTTGLIQEPERLTTSY